MEDQLAMASISSIPFTATGQVSERRIPASGSRSYGSYAVRFSGFRGRVEISGRQMAVRCVASSGGEIIAFSFSPIIFLAVIKGVFGVIKFLNFFFLFLCPIRLICVVILIKNRFFHIFDTRGHYLQLYGENFE